MPSDLILGVRFLICPSSSLIRLFLQITFSFSQFYSCDIFIRLQHGNSGQLLARRSYFPSCVMKEEKSSLKKASSKSVKQKLEKKPILNLLLIAVFCRELILKEFRFSMKKGRGVSGMYYHSKRCGVPEDKVYRRAALERKLETFLS